MRLAQGLELISDKSQDMKTCVCQDPVPTVTHHTVFSTVHPGIEEIFPLWYSTDTSISTCPKLASSFPYLFSNLLFPFFSITINGTVNPMMPKLEAFQASEILPHPSSQHPIFHHFLVIFLHFSPAPLLLCLKAIHPFPSSGSCSSLLISLPAFATGHPPHMSRPGWSFSSKCLIEITFQLQSFHCFLWLFSRALSWPPVGWNPSKKTCFVWSIELA